MKKRYTSDPNQALRRNAFTNKFNKIFLALVAFLLLGGKTAVGQEWVVSHSSADIYTYTLTTKSDDNTKFVVNGGTAYSTIERISVSGGATVKLIFNTSAPVKFQNSSTYPNCFIVNGNGSIEMELGPDYSTANTVTLQRTSSTNSMYGSGTTSTAFFIQGYSGNVANRKIVIKGKAPAADDLITYANSGYTHTVKTDTSTYLPKNQFVIDGGFTFSNLSWNNNGELTSSGTGKTGTRPLFRIEAGTLELENVTIQGVKNTASHGAIYLMTSGGSAGSPKNLTLKMTHCWMHDIVANEYPGVGIQFQPGKRDTGTGQAIIKRCKFSKIANNSGAEAAIRSFSGSTCSLQMDTCTLWKNFGGGVRWQSIAADKPTFKRCLVKDNFSKSNGAGILIKSSGALEACLIKGNKTINGYGGGIYFTTFEETGRNSAVYDEVRPMDGILTLDAATTIEDNSASNSGGGVAVQAQRMWFSNTAANAGKNEYNFYSYDQNGVLTGHQYQMTFQLNGATIKNNSAPNYGGGVYISRANDASFYGVYCDLRSGKIHDNTCSTGQGGGVCVHQAADSWPSDMGTYQTVVTPQDIDVKVSESTASSVMKIYGNTALNGGGMYIYTPNFTAHNGVTSKVSVNVNDYSEICSNTATASTSSSGGGGLYVQQGTVNIQKLGSTYSPSIHSNQATGGNGGGVYLDNGEVNLSVATIGGDAAANGNIAYVNGGGIYVNNGTVNMLSTTIQYNATNTGSGGGVYVNNGNVNINRDEAGTESPSNISNNTAYLHGGGIYNENGQVVAYGSFSGSTDYPITITHNTATNGSGGGIFCKGNSGASEYDIRLRRITLSDNHALGSANPASPIDLGCGGGIYLQQGKVSIINGTISGNTANVGGGGIYTKQGDIDINPTKDERHPTQIKDNVAGLNGGGLNTHKGFIRVFGNNSTDRIVISGNKALTGSGGGIFCYGTDVNTEYITVHHADLTSNRAKDGGGNQQVLTDVVSGCGGGMYLQKGTIHIMDVNIQSNYAKKNGGGINNHEGDIEVKGCIIGGDGTGNRADHSGGGIYTNAGDIDIEEYVDSSSGSVVRYPTEVSYNTAAENGGGINTHSGIVTVNKDEDDDVINIIYNTAKKGGGIYANAGTIIAYNANINNNTATENGGGMNNHAGDITLYGGEMSNNTAENGRGGGAFTHVGDVRILPFPKNNPSPTRNDGTQIYNNLAKLNGGGINNHTGRVDIRHATLRNNTATLGNGGGIFCEGPHSDATGFTIRLYNSELRENKTRGQDGTPQDPTGRGGGIYLKYGSIYAHLSDIIENFANVNGGGLDNHDGKIFVYGCTLDGNSAVTGRGGGIYTETGAITTGPSLVGSDSQATIIQNNVAHINGGGINNHHGDIFLNGDHILNNTAETGHGGGIYIANGTIDMYGGKIANNSSNDGNGGGVWSGGGEFNIQKREGKPIVEIIDVDVVRSDSATVHYHIVDKGNGTITVHGIYWDTTPEASSTGVPFNPSTPGHTQGSDPNCFSIGIKTGGSGGETYYVKAYATNSTPLTDYSDVTAFTTYSSMPTVISGAVAEITKNSAQGSGKLIHSNNATICGVCYKQVDGNLGSLSELEVGVTGVTAIDTTAPTGLYFENGFYFTRNLTGLAAGMKYFARVYAKNSNGYAYGDTVSFYTLKNVPDLNGNTIEVTNILADGATFTFTIPSQSSPVKAYGFVWSTDDDPALSEDHAKVWTDVIAVGTPTTITWSATDLTGATHYYIRAFATFEDYDHGADPSKYALSTPKDFYTLDAGGLPVVKAVSISGITQTSATIKAQLISEGSGPVTRYGVCYSTTKVLPTEHGTDCYHNETDGTIAEGDEFTFTIPNTGDLEINKTYYVRAYATNKPLTPEPQDNEYGYSNEFSFSTLPATIPNVVITKITGIDKTGATINCTVEDGGSAITEYGVEYWKDGAGSHSNKTNSGAPSNGTFSETLTGLDAHSLYHVRAFATNAIDTHICSEVTFYTSFDKPTVVFADPAILHVDFDYSAAVQSQNTARGKFTVTPTGSPIAKVKTVGICWSTLHNPVRAESEVANTHYNDSTNVADDGLNITTSTVCYVSMTQRYPNTRYWVRAYASINKPDSSGNLTDTVYSKETSFITLPVMQTDNPDNINDTYATLAGTINSRDTEYHLRKYGVCWSTSANPTINDSKMEADITSGSSSARSFSFDVTGLTANTTYYYRAYCINENTVAQGNVAYGEKKYFTTKAYGLDMVCSPTAGGTVNKTHVGLDENDTCEIRATANPGYTFNPATGWAVSGTGSSTTTANPTIFTMGAADATLTATFVPNSYTLTVQANPAAGGTVSIGDGSLTTTTVTYGSSVTIHATEASGYTFVNWTLNGVEVSTVASYSFEYNVAGNATYVANFEEVSGSKGRTSGVQQPRPRDIYPAPAREPWDWDDDEVVIAREVRQKQSTHEANALDCHASLAMTEDSLAMTDTLTEQESDTLAELRDRLSRTVTPPQDIPTIEYNTAEKGGGIYMAKNESNPAKLIFAGGANESQRGKVNLNYASEAGGGIYIDTTALMQMKDFCEVNGNRVPEGKDGGGIYLSGRLYVGDAATDAMDKHSLKVNQNFAINDASFYTNYVGHEETYTTTYKFKRNNVFLPRDQYSWETGNNPQYNDSSNVITLLSDVSGFDYTDSNSNGQYDAGETINYYYSSIGFSVPRGSCPVIATARGFGWDYLTSDSTAYFSTYEPFMNHLMPSASATGVSLKDGAVFDDTEAYFAIHNPTDVYPFRAKYIYLWGCWTNPAVSSDPENLDPMGSATDASHFKGHYRIVNENADDIAVNPSDYTPVNNNPLKWEIYSEEGLAWFSSYVNGLNIFAADKGDDKHHKYVAEKNQKAEAVLKGDVDLTKYFWVPIGSVTRYNEPGSSAESSFEDDDDHLYKGKFDGGGYTIKGMNCRFVTGIKKYGLFGKLAADAEVKNVFIDDAIFQTVNASKPYYVGAVAGLQSGNSTISACEARGDFDVTLARKRDSYVGGLVGKVESTGNVIHSSMAMPEIKGSVKYMGGLVGELASGNQLLNSFSNALYPDGQYIDTCKNGDGSLNSNIYIGGLVGVNNGLVENCYSRLRGTEPKSNVTSSPNYNLSIFGWLAGTNNSTGTINYCYAPTDSIDNGGVYKRAGEGTLSGHGTYDTTKLISGKYGFKHRDQAVTKAISSDGNTYINNDTIIGGLQRALNAWVVAKNTSTKTYHPWMRTMASPINDDYPIPNFLADQPSGGGGGGGKALSDNEDPRYNAVGSIDGVYMDYVKNVDSLWLRKRYDTLTTAFHPNAAMYLYNTNGVTPTDNTPKEVKITGNTAVPLYIHEDVGITQANTSDVLIAVVGVTFDNSDKGWLGGQPYDWHMFSSALTNAPIGLEYHTTEPGYTGVSDYELSGKLADDPSLYVDPNTYADRTKMDPPKVTFWQKDNSSEESYDATGNKIGYFPTNTPYGTWRDQTAASVGGSFDLYCYGEEAYQHWINFKREGTSSVMDHWRQDPDENGNHYKIQYYNDNDSKFKNGKGYLMAVSERSMLMADGTLNNGNVTYNATYTVNPMATVYDEMVRGTNLIGNPYQSYLDMDRFFTENSDVGNIYYIMDADKSTSTGRDYISYTKGSSYNPTNDAPPFLHPHQGFFVKVPGNTSNSTTSIIFNADMRVAGKWNTTSGLGGSHFRDRINYPLVNLLCYDSNNKGDLTTVEINRPEVGGGQKMKGLRSGKAILYSRFEDGDYQTLFAPEGVSEVPVRFEANEDDVFTMKWSMYNGNFNYVHLIDNLTGADVDMLAAQEYKFEGRTTDYISRFKLVFKVTDVDEYKDDDPGSKTFAFQMGDELIVNGAGILQMFDVTGRCLLSTQTAGAQSSVSLPKVAAGVYMLRLTGNQQNKVQKIIIK